MRGAVAVAVAAAVCGGALAAPARRVPYTLYGDVQVPLARHYRGLGNAVATAEWLWAEGKVRYFIDTTGTDPSAPLTTSLLENEPRVLSAVAHIEAHTCIRFTQCATEAACTKPYMRFQTSASGCNSPVGVAHNEINEINVDDGCGAMTNVHEILHSLGFGHEQARPDRDLFVAINTEEIEAGKENNFDIDSYMIPFGAYDYGSIMHYGASDFAKGSKDVIVAPYPIGQNSGLSAGDISMVQFLYMECQTAPAAPYCSSNFEAGVTHVVASGKEWTVTFMGRFSSSMTVAFDGAKTTAPSARLAFSATGSVDPISTVAVTYSPSAADVDQSYDLTATFTGGGASTECTVTFQTVQSDHLCYGKGNLDAAVCSGRGACMDRLLDKCECESNYGGLECDAFADCTSNHHTGFESGKMGMWTVYEISPAFDTSFAAAGSSWKLGTPDDTEQRQGWVDFSGNQKPKRVSFYMAAFPGRWAEPTVSIRDSDSNTCMATPFHYNGAWYVNGEDFGSYGSIEYNKFYRFDFVADWAAKTYSIFIDGALAYQNVPMSTAECASAGFTRAVFFGNGWLDEFKVWCSHYVHVTGTTLTADGVTQKLLREGGAAFTLSLVGDIDEWVPTEATKQALVEALHSEAPRGFTTRKGNVLSASDVSFTAGNKAAVVGPLQADAGYSFTFSDHVYFDLKASMFTSGKAPQWTKEDMAFTIRGSCEQGYANGFEGDGDLFGSKLEISTAQKRTGASAGLITAANEGYAQTKSLGSPVEASKVAMAFFTADAQIHWNTDVFHVYVDPGRGVRSKPDLDANDYTSMGGSFSASTWHYLEMEFDWTARTMTLKMDGAVLASDMALASTATSVSNVQVYSFTGDAYIDDMSVVCPTTPPAFATEPACPDPAADAMFITFFRGSDDVSLSDKFAIVPHTAADCSTAEADCGALGACSSSTGAVLRALNNLEWGATAGAFTGLVGGTSYKLCYHHASTGVWQMLEQTLTTCTAASPPATPPPSAGTTPTPAPPGQPRPLRRLEQRPPPGQPRPLRRLEQRPPPGQPRPRRRPEQRPPPGQPRPLRRPEQRPPPGQARPLRLRHPRRPLRLRRSRRPRRRRSRPPGSVSPTCLPQTTVGHAP
eukprot:TRINITY_DN3907_c0_g1_i3.p1 TRINITY_DN3907_c0_g1~~TRINITY_DN3907_c0_g1_i3.p1  ORF type:complete len:1118 (+),score=313.16 TRINITY_DN3907_c0_g1_i3:63-3416(+)